MNILLRSVLLVLFLASVPAVVAQDATDRLSIRDFKCTNLLFDNGLTESVYALSTTSDGFIWIGTFDGVIRFDGWKSTLFNRQNVKEMHEDDCGSLYVGKNDSLFIGLFNGLCLVYKDGIFNQIGSLEAFFNRTIYEICQDSSGTLWIAPDGKGVVSISGKQRSYYNMNTGLPSDNVVALCAGRNNEMWIGTDKGLCRFYDNKMGTFNHPEKREFSISALSYDANGTLWIGERKGGLWKLNQKGLKEIILPDYNNNQPITTINTEKENPVIWVGTEGNGLFRIDLTEGTSLHFDARNGLTSGIILKIIHDNSGDLLVGTHGGGLIWLTRNRVRTYTRQDGLADNSVTGLCADPGGNVYIGHENGKVSRYSSGSFTDFSRFLGSPGTPVFSIACNAGSLLAATIGPLILYDGKTRKEINFCSQIGNSLYHALFFSSNGDLWAGTDEGVCIVNGNETQAFTTKEGLTDNRIFCFMEDQRNRIWIGTQEGGISIYDQGKFSRITRENGLSDNMILALFEDRNQIVWIGTGHNGLNRYDPGTDSIFSLNPYLSQRMITHITEDGEGRIWLGTVDGIYCFDPSDVNKVLSKKADQLPVIRLGEEAGMLNSTCVGGVFSAGIKTKDGKLWFPTPDGIVEIDPNVIKARNIDRKIVITSILCNDDTVPVSKTVKLPAGVIHLDVHFTSPGLEAQGQLKFRYKLEGYDSEWATRLDEREARYTKVPPGSYKFVVEVTDQLGQWTGNQATVDITVKPFFYQTWWFALICIATTIFLVYLFFIFRMKQVREKELEVLVQKRTEEISRLNENLEQQVIERTYQLSASNTELEAFTYSVSHDLRAPVRRINGLIQAIIEDYGSHLEGNGRELLAMIEESSQHIQQLIEEFLKLSRITKQEIVRSEIDLSKLAEEILVNFSQQSPDRVVKWKIEPEIIINADLNLVRIMLSNLLDNAWKYTKNQDRAVIEMGLTQREGNQMIFIRDNGAGFDMNHYDKLFMPFQRLHSDDEFTGTGIGLATVKRIILKHGGKIFAEGGKNKGATFLFSFI